MWFWIEIYRFVLFQHFEGSHLGKQGRFPLRREWVWKMSWRYYLSTHPCLNRFKKRMKLFCKQDDFMLYSKLGVDCFSTSELLYPNSEKGVDLSMADLCFKWLATTLTSLMELLFVRFTFLVLRSKTIIARKNGYACIYFCGV